MKTIKHTAVVAIVAFTSIGLSSFAAETPVPAQTTQAASIPVTADMVDGEVRKVDKEAKKSHSSTVTLKT